MKKIGLLFTSRNNYELLDFWMQNVDTEGINILNIDEDSTKENKTKGKEICKKHNIKYMDREERGMLFNMVTACNYFESEGLEWIVWSQHDSFPEEGFFSKFDNLVTEKNLDNFGVVGFNVLHDRTWHQLARTPLQPEQGEFYDRYRANTPLPYKWSKPYAVESVFNVVTAVNISQYRKHIIPTSDYHFFHTWDDIAFQFLNKNIYNICLPDFIAYHNQDVKVNYGIPYKSPLLGGSHSKNEEEREYYFSKWGFKEVWFERWGFWYDDRNSFEDVKEHYKGTLLYDFYHFDRNNSPTPLKIFDL
tara:strand:+ start:10720 stop:11631 length:912 start_codon:yes stop_codon:yes gene_type:complete